MKKIEWTKKRILISIISAVTVLAVAAGGITAAVLLNSPDAPAKKKKKVVKKIVTVVDNGDGDADVPEDAPSVETDEETPILIKVIKNVSRQLGLEENSDTVTYGNTNSPVQTLYAKDFGVVGDGVTDDGKAIFDAVMALSSSGPGSTLIFESNKTYYAKSITLNSLIYLNAVEGVTIDGGNSTFLLDTLKEYMTVSKTKNCVIKNMHFDFKTKPAFRADFVSLDAASGSALMRADRDIGIAEGESYTPSSGWFGVINKGDTRRHMYIAKYTMVDASERLFRIYFTTDTNTRSWMSDGTLAASGMICPMPGIGHLQERGFTISGNQDLTLSNFKIHACARFGMYIGTNEGSLMMDAVDFVPAENALDSSLDFTSWRDAFHVKDNRCAITWQNCKAYGNYDDVFNISSSTLYVSDFNVAKNRISLIWDESSSGIYYTIKPGDTLNVIDTETGEDCGNAVVKRVVKQSGGVNIVVLEEPLELLTYTGKTVQAFFTNRCAPNSKIINCDFNGTFRFRGPLTVSNSTFYNMRTWIDLFDYVEGPIPKDITFQNCEFVNGASGSFIIGANSGNTGKNGYHVENIRFENCVLNSSSLSIYSSDQNYVTLRGCTEPNGTAIPDRN